MFKTINGWTKEKMKAQILLKNNGNQSRKSIAGFNRCAYRGFNGNACAVGCFIPDEVYVPEMEVCGGYDGADALQLLQHFPQVVDHMPLHPDGLMKMQDVHDSLASVNVGDDLIQWIDKNVEDT